MDSKLKNHLFAFHIQKKKQTRCHPLSHFGKANITGIQSKCTLTFGCRSIVVEPGTPVSFIPMGDIRITGAALDAKLSSETARSSVKLTYTPVSGVSEDEDDEEDEVEAESIVLCSLTPGKVRLSFFTSIGSYSVSFI